ncbi:hypothetical protein [Crenobacter intestini]|uniref:Uncharacterized protein n=1 Tax=Crenobacter intestini TaxID=2563443 RepID=A0A4T0UNG4_9NEIS|nr:hypothetical protein [Crenobacter intestini]TIC80292.1 hypothetical protein E5K04_12355 [Crenobacter intestini]
MIFLFGYFASGFAAFKLIEYLHRRTRPPDDLWAQLRARSTPPRTLTEKLLSRIFWPAFCYALVLPFWPVLVLWQLWPTPPKPLPVEPVFAVLPEHLQQQLSIAEIEAREKVFDPLGAVPDLPFGHHNALWRSFLAKREEHDELWSFEANWQPGYGDGVLFSGYALVREGAVGEYLVVVAKVLTGVIIPRQNNSM